MLNKESIVQRLLDEKLITTEEAVILLKGEDFNGIKYVPVPLTTPWVGPGPTQPYQPYTPSTPINPMYPQCDWTVRPGTMPYYGGTTHTGTTNPNSFAHTTNENYCAK